MHLCAPWYNIIPLILALHTFVISSPFRRVQIYRKVTSQILPSALDRVQNVRARDFIRGCLAPDPDDRPSAMDLLNLPFLKDKNEDEVRTRHWTMCSRRFSFAAD